MFNVEEGFAPTSPPALVRALAQQAATEQVPNPTPIKWRMSQNSEGEGKIVIVFEDGRKLFFEEEKLTPRTSVIKQAGAASAAPAKAKKDKKAK